MRLPGIFLSALFTAWLSATAFAQTLTYSSYFGGNGADSAWKVATDGQGNLYLAGFTNSADFPRVGGVGLACAITKGECAFVAKLDPTGKIIYSTYFPLHDVVLAADSAGNTYIAATTGRSDLPIVGGYQTAPASDADVYLVKLDPTGTNILYSTYYGGDGVDAVVGIAVNNDGTAYVLGSTTSAALPTTSNAYSRTKFSTSSTNYDAFYAGFDTTANGAASVLAASYFGSWSIDYPYAIAVRGTKVYLTGGTYGCCKRPGDSSTSQGFPLTAGAYTTYDPPNSSADVFVSAIESSSGQLLYSSVFGPDSFIAGIAIDGGGNAYIAGETFWPYFPTSPGALTNSDPDTIGLFVVKLDTNGGLVYSAAPGAGGTYERPAGINVDSNGRAYVSGTPSFSAYPVTANALRQEGQAFLLVLNATASARDYLSLLTPAVNAQTLDAGGNLYLAGVSNGAAPVTPNARRPLAVSDDASIMVFNMTQPDARRADLAMAASHRTVTMRSDGTLDFYFNLNLANNGPSTAPVASASTYVGQNSGFDLSAGGAPCSVTPPSFVTCNFNNLGVGQTATMAFHVAALWPTAVQGLAVSGVPDPQGSNDGIPYTDLRPRTDLALTGTPANATLRLGDQIDFATTITNNGPEPANHVWFSSHSQALNLVNGMQGTRQCDDPFCTTAGIQPSASVSYLTTYTAGDLAHISGPLRLNPGTWDDSNPANDTLNSNINIVSPCAVNTASPSVTICSPSGTVGETAQLIATATSSSPVWLYQVYVDGVKKANFVSYSFSALVGRIALPTGSHRFTVQAKDTAGRIFKATKYITVVAGCAPSGSTRSVTVCSPSEGSQPGSPVHVVAAAKPGSSPVTAMQIYVDRVKVKQVSGSKIDAYITMSSGWHRLSVQAVDSSGSFKWTEGVGVP